MLIRLNNNKYINAKILEQQFKNVKSFRSSLAWSGAKILPENSFFAFEL